MTIYRCDDGDDTHASDIEANSPEEAAETWAEGTHDNSAGEWSGGACVVRELDSEGGVVEERRFQITIDWSPDFHVFPA